MELKDIREKISAIDEKFAGLFEERMRISEQVAAYKMENNMPVYDASRERDVLCRVSDLVSEDMRSYVQNLYRTVFDLSKARQIVLLGKNSKTEQAIRKAMEETPPLFPTHGTVACQGIEGAYSQQACEKIFPELPSLVYFRTFDGVFTAVEQGLCEYGVLPIENSTYGSVNAVYDLMRRHRFHIVRSLLLPVRHCLLAKKGVKLEEITEVFSHEQGLGQCAAFLKAHPHIKATVCENTAVAARMVAQSDRSDVAAISSRNCAELYSLSTLSDEIVDSDNNYTRFICITKDMKIYPGANRISLMLSLPHVSGALADLLSKFSAVGVNIVKLESRPIPGTNFSFRFYLDAEGDPADEKVRSLIGSLVDESDEVTLLGCYTNQI
ncbi:MAG: bifunctional chorismate mutase/prephenate dehydratase [Ruminococcaceae bacterium]|nr:bifunctional chorismate mutase/prephenate dehydratase [Oscillospiraceae bacterium]